MTPHPYERIAEHYRTKIRDGELPEGTRLAPIKDLAREWDVAAGTIRHALTWLQGEGHIRTSPRGTFVANDPPTASTGYDRFMRLRRTGSTLAKGETKIVTAAELVKPPVYVADLFGLEDGDQVLRREYIIGRGSRRVALQVDWYPAPFGALVPALLSTAPGRCDDALKLIEDATGRTASEGRDAMHARIADAREAAHLGLPVGSTILAMACEWSDTDGILTYSELCLPPLLTIGYQYTR